MKQLNKYKSILTDFIFYISILFFIIGFNFSDNMVIGWYQQFMPNLGGRQIVDITFTDSLNGYAITNEVSDTSFILRTTNSGDNWFLSHFDTGICSYYNIQFINQSTGFVSGYIYDGSTFRIIKTTTSGVSWFYINSAFDVIAYDMFVLNQDTIWLVDSEGAFGGVFLTTNGGTSWIQQVNLGGSNPDRIYMYNARIGFIGRSSSGTGFHRTTDGGLNWTFLSNNEGLIDMFFVDSLTGWKSGWGGFKKTSNGGLNWITQTMPGGGYISTSGILRFININRDTIWGCGGTLFYPGQGTRAFLYRTTNQGNNWLIQVPDTSYKIPTLIFIKFTDKRNGWVYMAGTRGIHTTTGGDTTFYTGIQQIANAVPEKFILKQNYPNPFNPRTIIPYSLSSSAYVKLIAYDILGREVQKMVDNYQQAGEYEVDFMGKFTATGVYFYRMTVDDKIIDTKKMLMIK